MKCIYTVCNANELAQAIALGISVRKFHPHQTFYIGWVGLSSPGLLPEGIELLPIYDVKIPEWDEMCLRYTPEELVMACRPWFARAILEQHKDCQQITFLSPTVFLYQSSDLVNAGNELLLTPHLRQPLPTSALLDDKRILNIGMFHAGSWILIPTRETRFLLHWWSVRTTDRAKFDLCNGMCMDQLWLNYAPVWVPDTKIIDNPAWHFGLHSLLNYELSFHQDQYLVENIPLISVDFAGLIHFHPIWSDHKTMMSRYPLFGKLFKNYSELVRQFASLPKKAIPAPGINHTVVFPKTRKNMVTQLRSLTSFIDRFDIK